ncbi:unnamed protein product [Paramecium sonneborni]|uniref:Laminin EGF-like domain-containing protein n=1 Tax=Paramecium sonneborni TaxID=65129 RepID=A0A8S1RF28_9CILI|nr:unnamed protein product [Paramecium sonneborni]
MNFCRTLSQLVVLCTIYHQVKSSCDVFNSLTTPDTGQAQVSLDLSQQVKKDYGVGAWTRFQSQFEDVDTLDKKILDYHIFSEVNVGSYPVIYYIKLDKEVGIIYYNIMIQQQSNSYQLRELELRQELVGSKWVFFYFCFSQIQKAYNIFLYIDQDIINVQMISGGEYLSENEQIKQYMVGGNLKFQNQIFNISLSLGSFPGEISDLDFRIGQSNYYPDIPTFLSNIYDTVCNIYVCPPKTQTTILASLYNGGNSIIKTVTFYNKRFILFGWVKLNEITDIRQIETVLLRASFRKVYYGDKYQGEKAIYWKYYQSTLRDEDNGFEVSTYHNTQKTQISAYQTLDSDTIKKKSAFYKNAITYWHWFVYQEGLPNKKIELDIYFGFSKETQSFEMTQDHYDKVTYYFSIGGDRFNKGFNGEIRNLTFSYCQLTDAKPKRYCHYSCNTCFGPAENNCIDCVPEVESKRYLDGTYCLCIATYMDVGQPSCQTKYQVLGGINIQEALIMDTSGCQRNQFLVKMKDNTYCLNCPGAITPYGLYCIDCIYNPETWYLHPICKTDYLMPLTDSTDYVFMRRDRKLKDYEYFLINQNNVQEQPLLEPCVGCFGLTNSTINFIQKYTMNIIQKILCKNCYTSINGECINLNLNCDECDDNQLCQKCEQNYTLSQSQCIKCPLACPNCKYNSTGFYCKSCIEGYYFNSTLEQCQQCGQFCKICYHSKINNLLQCVQCIHNEDYFLAAELTQCLPKTMAHCSIQTQEFSFNYLNETSINQLYQLSLDLRVLYITYPTMELCLKCDPHYINVMKIKHLYGCYSVNDVQTITNKVLPQALKDKVLNDPNFQLGYHELERLDGSENYYILFGDPVVIDNIKYNPIVLQQIEPNQKICQEKQCQYCIQNYVYTQEYCIKCFKPYYAHKLSGNCIQCPSSCLECELIHKDFKDGWKSDLQPGYQIRSKQQVHHFNTHALSTSIDDYEINCLLCADNGFLHNGKCYPKCPCKECIIEDDEIKCITCENSIKTVVNGQCTECPQFCELCREFTSEEITQINPYFNQDIPANRKYAKQCLKRVIDDPPQGILYNDPTIGQEINCKNPQQKDCYFYVEFQQTIYCEINKYQENLDLEIDDNSKTFYKKYNLLLDHLFSTDNSTHFNLETDFLYNELNYKSVKLVRYIVNILPNTGNCKINKNTFILSNIRSNVFTVKNLELVIQSQINMPIQVEGNISFYEFSSVTLKNVYLLPISDKIQFNINSLYGVSFLIEQFKIKNAVNLQFQIKIQNPTIIQIKNIEISDSKLININGIITYYFTQKLENELDYSIDTILIKNCQIINSNLFVQLLDDEYGNQKLIANNFISQKNTLKDSVIFITQFLNQIRESKFVIQSFLSEGESLTNTSLFTLHGALSVILTDITVSNGNFNSNVKLFQLPLFTINNMIIIGNNFNSDNNRVITNIVDALYQDDISTNFLSFNKIQFKNNYYRSSKVFIELVQSQNFKTLEILIDGLSLESNQFTLKNYSNQMTSMNSSIYFDLTQITILNINIIRAFNLPEISINNADKIELNNLKASLNDEFKLMVIHQQVSCLQKNLQIGYGSMLQIFNSRIINFKNIEIFGLIVINLPIITIKSIDGSNFRQAETIQIKKMQFTNNTLILSKLAEQPSILSIISEQKQAIELIDINSFNNHHHSYQEDLLFRQSSTILIENPNSDITLSESYFSNNIITNNQGSNLILIGNKLEIRNCIFLKQNDIQFEYLKTRLIWGYGQDEEPYFENLYSLLSIKSKGGNGYFSANQISFQNISSQDSLGLQGGAFYFGTQSSGIIQISNCSFNYSQANLLMKEKSQGGTLFIDASQSDLFLSIMNNSFSNSFSRNEGGTIFIEPSRNNNTIIMQKNEVENVYSFKNAFLKILVTFSSKQLILQTQISDLSIKNTYNGYLNYLGRIQNLNDQEIQFQSNNFLISIDRSNLTIKDCNIINIFEYGALEILDSNYIKLDNLVTENFTIVSGSILKLNLNKKYLTSIQLINVQLKYMFEVIGDVSLPDNLILRLPELFYKCEQSYEHPKTLQKLYNEEQQNIVSLHNFYSIIKNRTNPSFIFEIDYVSENHYILIESLNIQKINCSNCQNGLLKFTNIDEVVNKNVIYLRGLNMEDNICGIISCFVLSAQSTNQIRLFWNQKLKRILDEVSQELDQKLSTIKIKKSTFRNNKATFGGSILISGLSLIVASCSFSNNVGYQVGGAIYFDYQQGRQLIVYDSIFANNQAKVGGGLFLSGYQLNSPSKMNNIFQGNQALYYGNNVADQPTQLTLKIGNQLMKKEPLIDNSTNKTDIIVINKYKIGNKEHDFIMLPSGQTIGEYQIFDEQIQSYVSYNLTFRIIALNDENNQIKALDGSKCSIQSRQIINQQEGEFYSNFTSYSEVYYNTTSQDYNLDNMIIYFDPDYSSQGYLQLEIICNSIKIPQFQEISPYQLLDYFTNYRLRIDLQTFPCQRGEYKTKQGTCKLCDANSDQYNVKAGDQCQIKDPIKMQKVSSARVMLRPEYWRPFESSNKIEYCLNLPENCIGGWNPGNDLCSEAHIGALCEQCDMYNIRGQGSYSVSTPYKCGSCNDIGDNTLKVILVSIWTMISIFLSVKGTVETVEKMVTQNKLSHFKIFAQDPKAGYGSVLIKVLTNYLQIIGAVATFQLKIPSGVQSSIRSVGNPTEAMSFSLDCFLVNLIDIDIIYFRMIWALIMPLIYILSFIVIYIIAIILNLTKPNKSALTTTAIYLFTYLQPTLIGGFISLLSFRYISNYYWIQGNVSYQYDTQTHLNWILTFILPSTLALAFIIPAFMFISLYQQRFLLETENTRKNWGYLYNEYSSNAYFWEIIKILQKGFIIIFLTFYEDLIIIKGALVFIIVFIYQLLTRTFKPYKLQFLNLIDEFSTLICGISIVLGITIYQSNLSDNQEIIWPFYILLIIFNSIFILVIVWEIILAQLEDQQENLDKVRDLLNKKYPHLKESNWFFKKLLTNRGQQQKRVKRRFQMIRRYLKQIVRNNPGIYQMPTPAHSFPDKPVMFQNQEKQNLLQVHQQSSKENTQMIQKKGTKVYPLDQDQRTFESVRYDDKRQSP